ncbi:SGNH/GDSL hydrolase family protein [Streptomyces sp. NPDC048389]|uniref:SGNH/GDSL hydrolase family protein n=1 Tax=Streptomyces sp. NPDC048389 TaxID=3154622 RepID=UPI003454055B
MRVTPGRAAAVAAVAAATFLAAAQPSSAAAARDKPLVYVALGDSAAAGPGLPEQDLTRPGCFRSHLNYPSLVAGHIGADVFRDVTCTSATTKDFTEGQQTLTGQVPPQYDALSPDTDLVTVHIGANDIKLVSTVLTCVNLLPDPLGTSCHDKLTAGGADRVSQQIQDFASRIGEAARSIRGRAPQARVYFVGYGTYLRPGGCYPVQPFWSRDADYIQSKLRELNAAIAWQAGRNGAGYIDQTAASVGHDSCAPFATRWFEGIIKGNVTVPLHPTVLGMQGTSFVVTRALQR